MRMAFLFSLFLVASCQPKLDTSDIAKAVNSYTCTLTDDSGNAILCLSYSIGYNSPSADCETAKTNYWSQGVTKSVFVTSLSCYDSGLSGKCSVSGKNISYYAAEMSSGSAQTDCNTLGGSFTSY